MAVNTVPKKAMYTPSPPLRDKYWVSLGSNFNGKLGERAFAGLRDGAPDISWPQVGMGPHSSLSNHGQVTIIARLGWPRLGRAAQLLGQKQFLSSQA